MVMQARMPIVVVMMVLSCATLAWTVGSVLQTLWFGATQPALHMWSPNKKGGSLTIKRS